MGCIQRFAIHGQCDLIEVVNGINFYVLKIYVSRNFDCSLRYDCCRNFWSTFVEVVYEYKNVNSIVRVRVDTAGAHGLD